MKVVWTGIVYPTEMNKGISVTGGYDNIDYDPSGTNCKTSFHRTGLSIVGYKSAPICGSANIFPL